MQRRILTVAVLCTACLAACGDAWAEFHVERVASGLNQPTFIAQAPGDPSSLYIVERQGPNTNQAGRILKFDFATRTSDVFLDFTGNSFTSDGGILSMAFHPDFQTNGKFYTATAFNGGVNNLRDRVQEYRVVDGEPVLQRTLLQYDNLFNPFHTVNMMAFDPLAAGDERDYMLILLGDGGTQANQPQFVNNSQDLSQVYGKILRIDVSDGLDAYPGDPLKNFGIPDDNPFAEDGDPGTLDEIFASGFRNPYRGSYDRQTGDFFVGDVGFNVKEEVSFIKAGTSGDDFGWARREGTIENPVSAHGGPQGDSLNPIYEYDHSTGNVSVTSGYVYRGPVEELQGTYFFSDFVSGRVFTAEFDRDTDPATFNGNNLTNLQDRTTELESLIYGGGDIRNLTSFGEDLEGNLYLVKFGNDFFPPNGQGEIFRVVPGPPIVRSDLNLDGLINLTDWGLLVAGNGTDLSGLSFEQAYAKGDLDGDFDNDYFDFLLFRQDFNQANGAGALERQLAGVPEPTAAALLLLWAAILAGSWGRFGALPVWAIRHS